MRKVGSREFKKHMGKYMRAVRGGQSLLLTIRGKVVARMSPLRDTQTSVGTLDERLKELEAQGLIHLPTKPLRKFQAIKSRGKSASQMIIEDRHLSFGEETLRRKGRWRCGRALSGRGCLLWSGRRCRWCRGDR